MGLSVAVKQRPGAGAVAADLLRRAVAGLDHGIAVPDLRPLDARVAEGLGPRRALGAVTVLFGSAN